MPCTLLFSYRCSFNVFFCIFIISVYDAQKTKVLQTSPLTMLVKTRNGQQNPLVVMPKIAFRVEATKHQNLARNFSIEMPHLIQNQQELVQLPTRPPPPFLLLLLLTLPPATATPLLPLLL